MFAGKSHKVWNNINIQSTSGGIYKSHPKSFIVRTRLESSLTEEMIDRFPRYRNNAIVVLQVVFAPEGYILVEFMLEKRL